MKTHQTQAQAQPDDKKLKVNEPVIHAFLPNSPIMCFLNVVRMPDDVKGELRIAGINCYWFDDKGNYCSEMFDSRSIRRATSREIQHHRLLAEAHAQRMLDEAKALLNAPAPVAEPA